VRIADFALERFFARWEFAVEYLLCASDVEGWPMADLLALADDETREMWDGLKLGYTVSIRHDGRTFSGAGEKSTENGRSLPRSARRRGSPSVLRGRSRPASR